MVYQIEHTDQNIQHPHAADKHKACNPEGIGMADLQTPAQ